MHVFIFQFIGKTYSQSAVPTMVFDTCGIKWWCKKTKVAIRRTVMMDSWLYCGGKLKKKKKSRLCEKLKLCIQLDINMHFIDASDMFNFIGFF